MKDVLKRIHLLVIKMISRKGLVFFTATLLIVKGYIEPATWVFAAGAVLGTVAYEKTHAKEEQGGK